MAVFTPRKFTTPPYGRPLKPEELACIPLALYDDETFSSYLDLFFENSKASFEPLVQSKDVKLHKQLLAEEKAAILTDTFSLHVAKRFKNGVIRTPEPTLKLYVGFFAGIKLSKNDPERQYMVRFQEMIKEKYGMYAKQNQVPHPNYNWSFDGD
ncbi:MAG: hypothetical protein ACI37P_02915 [Eggerthellaceae bacterium]